MFVNLLMNYRLLSETKVHAPYEKCTSIFLSYLSETKKKINKISSFNLITYDFRVKKGGKMQANSYLFSS